MISTSFRDMIIYGLFMMLLFIYYFTIMIKSFYSSTSNLFITITFIASIIFFMLSLVSDFSSNDISENPNNGLSRLYFIISGILFIVSFIINLFTKRNQTNIGRINQTNINRINIRKNL